MVHTKCNACGSSHPVRGYVDKAVCPTCQRTGALLDWNWVVVAPWTKATEKDDSGEKSARNLLGAVAPGAVVCPSCKTEAGEALVAAAIVSTTLTVSSKLECTGCHAKLLVRRAPIKSGTESLEGGRYWNAIIGEDPGLVLGPEHAEPAPKAGALAYPCTQCGAQLLVDGSTRTPTCQYCSTRIFLPDSLWSALHPLPQAVPFYLWLDPERVAVRKKVRRADKAVVVYAILAWIWLITIMPILGGSLSWGVSGAISAVMVPLLLVLCIRSIDRGSVSQ